MVRINIEEKEKSEAQAEDASQETKEEQVEDVETEEKHEKKEFPLEHMKKAELLEKVKEVQAASDKNYELFLRSQAEIENIKKRFQKEKSDLIKFSNESLIKQLLSVIDHLEKAIAATQEENPIKAVSEGVELTLKGLIDTLQRSGLTEVQTEGQPFDPNFHQAVSEQEDENVDPGTIIHVLQKGYTLNDRLIRPAMVIVSKK